MFERAIIHVAGPAGSGKTAFIEQMVHALGGEEVACVRGIADASVREPSESAPEGHPELDRWRRAGATAVALYRFDPNDGTIADDFYATDVMATFAGVMVIEGDSPVDTVDLEVFVARLPGPGATLLRRATRPGRRGATAEKWSWRHRRPRRCWQAPVGPEVALADRSPAARPTGARREAGAARAGARPGRQPAHAKDPGLARRFTGAGAGVVGPGRVRRPHSDAVHGLHPRKPLTRKTRGF
jgi:hypothetical protein